MLKLYSNPMSRGRIARWMLEETGQPYEVEMVPFGPAMKSPGYRTMNPMGKVPVLVHDGRIVTEAAAICAYLADAFPQAGLAPAPPDRADYYRWLFFAAGPLEQAVTNNALGVTVPEDRRGMVGYGSFDGYLEVPTNDYVLQVQLSDGTPVVSYQAPLATLGLNGAAITVVASGFLDPSVNSDGAPFGLWVALPSTGPLVELPLATSVRDLAANGTINAWPNPASDVLTVDVTNLRDARSTVMITDAAGRVVADMGNAPVQQFANLMTIPVSGLAAGSYQLSFIGANGRSNVPFQIVR